MVADINPGPSHSDPYGFTLYDSLLYFQAKDDINGRELWKYDGITPPSLVIDIRPGQLNSYPQRFKVFNNNMYFSACDNSHGQEL